MKNIVLELFKKDIHKSTVAVHSYKSTNNKHSLFNDADRGDHI